MTGIVKLTTADIAETGGVAALTAKNINALHRAGNIATDQMHKNIVAAASTLKAYNDADQVFRAIAPCGMTLWATIGGAPRLVDAVDAIPDRSASPAPLVFPMEHPTDCPCSFCLARCKPQIQAAFQIYAESLVAVADVCEETENPEPDSQLAHRIETYRDMVALIGEQMESGALWNPTPDAPRQDSTPRGSTCDCGAPLDSLGRCTGTSYESERIAANID